MTTQGITLEDQKTIAEIAKLYADAKKAKTEALWHPIFIAAALMGAGAALAKLFL